MLEINSKTENLIRILYRYSIYPLFFKFRMSRNERKVLNKYIRNSKYYLEFGAGGSTLHALVESKAIIHSVESSTDWINYMCRYYLIKSALKKRLFFHYVDIGKTKEWGRPVSNESRDLFPKYSKDIFDSLDSNYINTVLIDGRFRVACLLSVIMNLPSTENTVILFHDFWDRDHYHIALKYITEIERADTLGVFRVKDEIDLGSVKQDYETYKFIDD